jgi:membrane-associated phospholipid phosphatase
MELNYIWQFLSYFGDIAYWLGFTISFFLIYPFLEKKDKERSKWILFNLLPAVIISYFFTFVLKLIFHIPRICVGASYCPSTYSFPSGHATVALAFSTVIYLHFKKKHLIHFLAFLLAFLVCLSRIMMGVHTLKDVLVGAIIGTITSMIWYFFSKKIDRKFLST